VSSIATKIGKSVRDLLLAAAAGVERLGGKVPPPAQDGPFQYLNGDTFDRIFVHLRRNPRFLLEVREVRQMLAGERIGNLMAAKSLDRVEGGGNVAHNTVDYNIQGAITAATLDRPSVMVNVVTSIERVWKNISKLDVLSIGPRSEIEIFAILAAGFDAARTKALDLFSYSPYVQAGDMHAMPYPDNSFDIVFVGWVLSYSRDQQAAAREIFRVCRDRAIVVLAGDYSDESRDRSTFKNDTTHMQSTAQVLRLFEGYVGNIYFRHEPEQPEIGMVMTVFEVRK
jgi:SAM-dependent methyltransferase